MEKRWSQSGEKVSHSRFIIGLWVERWRYQKAVGQRAAGSGQRAAGSGQRAAVGAVSGYLDVTVIAGAGERGSARGSAAGRHVPRS